MVYEVFKDFSELSNKDQRKIVNGSVVPRPIAWVSTLNEDDSINLAPFSYFNVVAANILSISFLPRGEGKDTLRNILRTKEAVINTASIANLKNVNLSSLDYDYMDSEVTRHNIAIAPSKLIKTPQVREALISFETELLAHYPVFDKDGHKKSDLVLMQVIGVTFKNHVLDEEKMYINIDTLNPASRLAGVKYGNTTVEEDIERIDKKP